MEAAQLVEEGSKSFKMGRQLTRPKVQEAQVTLGALVGDTFQLLSLSLSTGPRLQQRELHQPCRRLDHSGETRHSSG